MENRLKNILRPRPNIGMAETAAGACAPKAQIPAAKRPSLMQAPVLVLNATFEPINVTAVRRALVLMLKGVAQAEETNHAEVHSTSKAMQVPSVIRLADVPAHPATEPRALAQKYFAARPEYLPVLRECVSRGGADSRPRDAAFARRPLFVGEPGGVLLFVQQQQRRSHARRSGLEVAAPSAAVHAAHFAPADAPDRAPRREVAQVSFLLICFAGNLFRELPSNLNQITSRTHPGKWHWSIRAASLPFSAAIVSLPEYDLHSPAPVFVHADSA